MIAEIQKAEQRVYEAAYAEGRRDTLDQVRVGEALFDGCPWALAVAIP
jgi:hypothetical protein